MAGGRSNTEARAGYPSHRRGAQSSNDLAFLTFAVLLSLSLPSAKHEIQLFHSLVQNEKVLG